MSTDAQLRHFPPSSKDANTNPSEEQQQLSPVPALPPSCQNEQRLSLPEVLLHLPALDPEAPFELEITPAPQDWSRDPATELAAAATEFSPDTSSPRRLAATEATTSTAPSVLPLMRVSRWHDGRVLFLLSLPNMAFALVVTLSSFFNTMFIGRLGAEYIGALTLARMITNLTGNNIAQGAASALEALCSQAYGAGAYALVGRWTQRCMLLLTLLCVPTLFLWMQTERILRAIGIEATEAALAGRYALISTAGIWPL